MHSQQLQNCFKCPSQSWSYHFAGVGVRALGAALLWQKGGGDEVPRVSGEASYFGPPALCGHCTALKWTWHAWEWSGAAYGGGETVEVADLLL